jgi:hypothetical protein
VRVDIAGSTLALMSTMVSPARIVSYTASSRSGWDDGNELGLPRGSSDPSTLPLLSNVGRIGTLWPKSAACTPMRSKVTGLGSGTTMWARALPRTPFTSGTSTPNSEPNPPEAAP